MMARPRLDCPRRPANPQRTHSESSGSRDPRVRLAPMSATMSRVHVTRHCCCGAFCAPHRRCDRSRRRAVRCGAATTRSEPGGTRGAWLHRQCRLDARGAERRRGDAGRRRCRGQAHGGDAARRGRRVHTGGRQARPPRHQSRRDRRRRRRHRRTRRHRGRAARRLPVPRSEVGQVVGEQARDPLAGGRPVRRTRRGAGHRPGRRDVRCRQPRPRARQHAGQSADGAGVRGASGRARRRTRSRRRGVRQATNSRRWDAAACSVSTPARSSRRAWSS